MTAWFCIPTASPSAPIRRETCLANNACAVISDAAPERSRSARCWAVSKLEIEEWRGKREFDDDISLLALEVGA